ncbi:MULTISPECIES: aminoglycoside phosphotransferase family protein [unclassified Actinopolyspora]|uniref:phosphotransferase family protein n=1 Tax=unclassified Actinopolyspora TaxID=2639451 RepID=UPI0013F63BE2|nr:MULTISPECIES: aminoglycoside phosphotransferase family protein [unclassified Actinopolyspora]NHD19574.1 phosphotransferase [Actinopolyspora sp. BKK2]NHE78730.1 phosphotransferase [Actinopolyspora sp. BKK1]
MDDAITGTDESELDDPEEELDRARRSATAAVNTTFASPPLIGLGGRSVVYLSEYAVLKVYTHRQQGSCRREAVGIHAAAHATDLRVPEVIAHDERHGTLAWLATTRLSGTQPASHEATQTLGQIAARLHNVPVALLAGMPDHRRRLHELPEGTSPAHAAAGKLDSAMAEAAPAAKACCTRERGFVHGDLSSRNVLLAQGQAPGVIDLEDSGVGCFYDDLSTLVLHESLLGTRNRRVLLAAYDAERRRVNPAATVVHSEHLTYHLVLRARWILQWTIHFDPELAELAEQIIALVPWLISALTGLEAV